VVAKKAKFFVGGEMNNWFGTRIPAAGGSKEQVVTLRFGATRKLGGVSIWSVPSAHSNGISPVFLSGDIAKEMEANGLTAYVGPLTDMSCAFPTASPFICRAILVQSRIRSSSSEESSTRRWLC
jgi:hypothetical protein